jgi:hypothetical protein
MYLKVEYCEIIKLINLQMADSAYKQLNYRKGGKNM